MGEGGGSRLFKIRKRRGLNVFIKKFREVSSLIARYILRRVHWLSYIVECKQYM